MSSNEENKQCGFRHGRRKFWIPFAVLAIVALKSAAVFLLWNHLVPDLFRGPEITYLQALGLLVLSRLLFGFGGFRKFGGHHPHAWRRHWLSHLSPEEREKFREKLARRCGHGE